MAAAAVSVRDDRSNPARWMRTWHTVHPTPAPLLYLVRVLGTGTVGALCVSLEAAPDTGLDRALNHPPSRLGGAREHHFLDRLPVGEERFDQIVVAQKGCGNLPRPPHFVVTLSAIALECIGQF